MFATEHPLRPKIIAMAVQMPQYPSFLPMALQQDGRFWGRGGVSPGEHPTPTRIAKVPRPLPTPGYSILSLIIARIQPFNNVSFVNPLPAGGRSFLSISRRLQRQGVSFTAAAECCGPRHLVKRARRSYDLLKNVLVRRGTLDEPSLAIRMLCGTASGVTAVLCTLPFDTIRARLWQRKVKPTKALPIRVALPRIALLSALCLPLFDLARSTVRGSELAIGC